MEVLTKKRTKIISLLLIIMTLFSFANPIVVYADEDEDIRRNII